MSAFAVMVSRKPMRIYMGGLILDIVHAFLLLKLFPMVSKGLRCLVKAVGE